MKDKDYLSRLNENQRKAACHVDGPLFVVAGAGTGKTSTLTARLAYLIDEHHAEPSELLAVTFTNKAAKEMKSRVASIVGDDAYQMWVLTFHAFGLRILRKHIEILKIDGLNNRFNVCDEEDAVLIIREILKELQIEVKDMTPKVVRARLSQYQNLEISVMSQDNSENSLYEKILILYQERLIKDNLVDFDGLLLYTLKIFSEHKLIRDYYQHYFKYVLVDEFQDTNIIQYNIIRLLTFSHKNIFVVGDPDQSIYSFRGANYANNELFKKEFNAELIVLEHNYRSNNQILKKANTLIKHNKSRVTQKELLSDLGDGSDVIINRFNNDLEETYFVAREINSLVDIGYQYADIAILYRNNNLSRIIEETLIRSQIPYIIYGGISFFERREIKDVLAYIRCSIDFNQSFYLRRIINTPRRKLGPSTIDKLQEKAFQKGVSYYQAIDFIEVSNQTRSNLLEFKRLLEKLNQQIKSDEPISNIVDDILKLAFYKDYLKEEGEEGLERIENVLELKNIFARGELFYEGNKKEKLQAILDEIALITDLEASIAEEDRVVLSTYHQVKGLEFKVVFMPALEEGLFPNPNRLSSEADLEEERRVAYVGITRTKERLYVSSAKQRYRYGHIENFNESRFVKEMNPVISKPKLTHQIPQQGLLKAGDKVTHQIFGDGIVVQVKEKIAIIAFKMPHGIKQIMEDHPALRKIN